MTQPYSAAILRLAGDATVEERLAAEDDERAAAGERAVAELRASALRRRQYAADFRASIQALVDHRRESADPLDE